MARVAGFFGGSSVDDAHHPPFAVDPSRPCVAPGYAMLDFATLGYAALGFADRLNGGG
jgi:hypothetical protein